MSAASYAGRFDARHPTLRIQLFGQVTPAVQRALFVAAPDVEPPCDHPEGGWQRALFGGEPEYCCTHCGAELPEPEVMP